MNYVYPRNGASYQLRYPVPADLQMYFPKVSRPGFRTWLGGSLGTTDRGKANLCAAERVVHFQRMFDWLRGELDDDGLRALLRRAYEFDLDDLYSSLESPQRGEVLRGILSDRAVLNLQLLGSSDMEVVEASAGWLADMMTGHMAGELVIPRGTPMRNRILKIAAGVLIDSQRAKLAILDHRSPPPPKSPSLEPERAPAAGENTALTKAGRLAVKDYFEVYLTRIEGEGRSIRPRTLQRRADAWRKLCASVGEELPLWRVTKAHLWEFHDALCKFPRSAGVTRALQPLSFHQKIAARQANPEKYPAIARETVGDLLGHVHAVFAHSTSRGDLAFNPATNVKPISQPSKEPEKEPFTVTELNRLFAHPAFAQCAEADRDDIYWVPILLLFTGARCSEVFLKTEDVILDGEVPHLRLIEYPERSLKNPSSSRLVPIHPKLIELGFLDYCRAAKRSGWQFLFPKWTWSEATDQKPSEAPRRRRFNDTILKQAGITNPKLSMHSLRHTFETAMASAGIPDIQARVITGRAIGGSRGRYVHDLDLATLAEVVSRVRYPKLEL